MIVRQRLAHWTAIPDRHREFTAAGVRSATPAQSLRAILQWHSVRQARLVVQCFMKPFGKKLHAIVPLKTLIDRDALATI